jgi:Skp family chaperone for outer membrane proteins
MPGARSAAILALVLTAGPVVAQEAPPLPVTESPLPDAAPPAAPATEPVIVPAPVQGQSAAVVTVDQDRLFAGSAWGRRMQAEFEQAGVELSAENDRLAAQLAEEEAQLTEQRATLEPAEFRKLAEAFDARATEVRRERAQAVQDLNARIDAEQDAFFQAVVPLIGQLMQDRGAVLVVDRRTVLMSAEGIDITADLIARVDAELGDGSDQPEVTPEPPETTVTGAEGAPTGN